MWWGIMLLITRGDSFFFPFWVLNSDGGEKWEQKKKEPEPEHAHMVWLGRVIWVNWIHLGGFWSCAYKTRFCNFMNKIPYILHRKYDLNSKLNY